MSSSDGELGIETPAVVISQTPLSCTSLKTLGNNLFVENKFLEAIQYYSQGLALIEENGRDKGEGYDRTLHAVLFSNRSAARLSLGENIEEALKDAEDAIKLDPTSLKAYYRKSSVLEKMDNLKDAYKVWLDAKKNCEITPLLSKQLKASKAKWLG